VVLAHIRSQPGCGPLGVWGRSMGAVTALLHADRDPGLCAICLDSPFASLRRLAEDLSKSRRFPFRVPSWLVEGALAVVRMRCQALADFDIEDLVPLENAKRSSVPAIFMHGRQDTFITPWHSKQLYNAYLGPKQMVTVEGDHNSERSQQAVNQAVGFFRRNFAARPHGTAAAAKASSTQVPPMGMAPMAQAASWAPPSLQQQQQQQQQQTPHGCYAQAAPGMSANSRAPVLMVEYSPHWQAVLESRLHQLGLAAPEARRHLRALDCTGRPLALPGLGAGAPAGSLAPAPASFPLAVDWAPAPAEWQAGSAMVCAPAPVPGWTEQPGWHARMAGGGA